MTTSSQRMFMTVFPTALGWMAGAWNDEMLLGLTFNQRTAQTAHSALATIFSSRPRGGIVEMDISDHPPTPQQGNLIARLQAFAEGTPDDFQDIVLDLSHTSDFQRRVIHYCRGIPAGKVLTYGQLAQKAGSPGAARAVGRVMATNRWPLIVPCHRVVGAGGLLGGFSAPSGVDIKRRLLERENASLAGLGSAIARDT